MNLRKKWGGIADELKTLNNLGAKFYFETFITHHKSSLQRG